MGGQLFIKPEYCKLILEIKSNATGNEIKKTNENFKKIKEIDTENKPLCGLFCYNTVLEKKTILSRFGWTYDKDLESWKENINLNLEYSYIDFIICIACLEENEVRTEKQFFLMKDDVSERYILRLEYPIIKNFFGITDNL
jgi:hypothetical protein